MGMLLRREEKKKFFLLIFLFFSFLFLSPSQHYSLSFSQAKYLVDAAVCVKCFGVATSYLLILGDLTPPSVEVLGASPTGLLSHRDFWIAISMVE